MIHTCEHCGLKYETVAHWHCPSTFCIARRKVEGRHFEKLMGIREIENQRERNEDRMIDAICDSDYYNLGWDV